MRNNAKDQVTTTQFLIHWSTSFFNKFVSLLFYKKFLNRLGIIKLNHAHKKAH